jgi:hypothetical protein
LATSTINHTDNNISNNRQSATDSYVPSVVVPAAYPMTITVTSPIKELDGTKEAFISYLITTEVL